VWIDRGSAGVAIKRGEMPAQITQVKKLVNSAKQVIGRNVIVEIE
jgi:hypothetical protein